MADKFKLRLILAVHQQGPPPGGYKTGIPHPYNKFFYKDTTVSSEPRAAQKVRFLPAAGEEFLPDNLDWYPGLSGGNRLFAAATEDERVTTLEANHALSGHRMFDDERVDPRLTGAGTTRMFPDINFLSVRRPFFEQFGRCQTVVENDVCLAKEA